MLKYSALDNFSRQLESNWSQNHNFRAKLRSQISLCCYGYDAEKGPVFDINLALESLLRLQ